MHRIALKLAARIHSNRNQDPVVRFAGFKKVSDATAEMLIHNICLIDQYKPSEFSGPVCFFFSRVRPQLHSLRLEAAWRTLVPMGVRTFIVPGNHGNILRRPASSRIAGKINELLVGHVACPWP